jgi:hypothetical protein
VNIIVAILGKEINNSIERKELKTEKGKMLQNN